MLHRIKHAIKNNKTIVGNIFSLGTLQIFSYILPLITLPYITRVIGPEKYGIVAFAGAFVAYFLIFVNYGFNLTATRDISINREDKNKISEIFWNIIAIKICLGIIAALLGLILVFNFDIFYEHLTVFLFSLLAILGEILFPIWLFQGMERMKYITIVNVIVRTLFLIPIFVVIREVEDYMYLPLIASLSSITIGIIAFIMSVRVFQISFHIPTRGSIVYNMKEGWHVFVSTLFISLYTTSTTFILGIFTTPTIVGYYASAEKLVKAVQGLIGSVSQAIYPSISQKLIQSREKTIVFLKKITLMISICTIVLSTILFFGANTFIHILFGSEFTRSIAVMQILSALPFVVALSNIFGVLTMLQFGYKKQFSYILMFSSVFSIAISIPFVILYAEIGMAFAVLITETLITASMLIFLYKKNFFK